ncbi:TPA: hypothetical protein NJZ94_003692 [Vibrio parahaemolyticus]|nr:hypothetical protein [Vibrio parahaemolyticus]
MRVVIDSIFSPFINPKFAAQPNPGGSKIEIGFHLYRQKRLFRSDQWWVVRLTRNRSWDHSDDKEGVIDGRSYIDNKWRCDSLLDALWRYNKIVSVQPEWD